jgi:hypothetical protein
MCIQLHTSNMILARPVWLPHVSPGTERQCHSPMGRQCATEVPLWHSAWFGFVATMNVAIPNCRLCGTLVPLRSQKRPLSQRRGQQRPVWYPATMSR